MLWYPEVLQTEEKSMIYLLAWSSIQWIHSQVNKLNDHVEHSYGYY